MTDRPRQVLDEVLRRLDPAGEPDQVRRHRGRPAASWACWDLEERLDAAREAPRERESSVAAADPRRLGWRERDHPGVAATAGPTAPGAAQNSLTARALSVCATMRRYSVRARCTRKQSSGPGTAPTEF